MRVWRRLPGLCICQRCGLRPIRSRPELDGDVRIDLLFMRADAAVLPPVLYEFDQILRSPGELEGMAPAEIGDEGIEIEKAVLGDEDANGPLIKRQEADVRDAGGAFSMTWRPEREALCPSRHRQNSDPRGEVERGETSAREAGDQKEPAAM